ncbi:MAG: ABC transporter ATP-binding protein [Thermoplasmata archaeon]
MSLEVSNVSAGYYEKVDVIHDISLHAEDAKTTSIIGPNGSGKSTLLKTIYGFLKPRTGSIRYNGVETTDIPSSKLLELGIAYITQERNVFPFMSVEENLELGAWILRGDRQKVKSRVDSVYERYPILRARKDVMAGRLSGGEQRMLELGRAMMTAPKCILFDEPTVGLAPKVAKEISGEIGRLKADGITIVLVDQNVREAIMLADYLYVLDLGRVAEEGPKGSFEGRMKELVTQWLTPIG